MFKNAKFWASAHGVDKSMLGKISRAYSTIRENGLDYFFQNYAYALPYKLYKYRKKKVNLRKPTWQDINFEAFGINASAKLLLNPSDAGFSKEFGTYGFREPLNTFAIFNKIAKDHPFVLDIGGNLGYFPLVELAAGAEKVVVVEPVPSTFSFLTETLKSYENAEIFNLAISAGQQHLKLYVGENRNVTSASKLLLKGTGHEIYEEISAEAITLEEFVHRYPITMIRMDIEGYEFCLFSKDVPYKIRTICIELHVLPPYDKKQALNLVEKLEKQSFRASVVISEMDYGYYPIVHYLGLKNAYKVAKLLLPLVPNRPLIKVNPSSDELKRIFPEYGTIHLILQR